MDDVLRGGIEQRQQGDFTGAIATFTAILQDYPDLAAAYGQRAIAYFDAGQLHGAISDYTQALALDRDNPKLYYGRAVVRLALGNIPGAQQDVEAAIQRDRTDAASHELQGTLYRKQGNVTGAIASFKTAADLYLKAKDAPACRRCLDKITPLKPKSAAPPPVNSPATPTSHPAALIYPQLIARIEAGEAETVRQELDWLLHNGAEDGNAYRCRGWAQHYLSQSFAALSDLNRAIQLNPQDAIAFCYRGQVRCQLGETGGALADLEAALALNPNAAGFWVAKGDIYHAQQAHGDAIAAYTHALELDPHSAIAYVHRAQAQIKQENLRPACDDYQQAASLYCQQEDWPRYQAILDHLKTLQGAGLSSSAPQPDTPRHQALLALVGGQWGIAERLIQQAKAEFPGRSEVWYLEKVIADLERDRP
ncbi:tetratricopeptide repeat protein [Spirulina major]|uniref:tetratricopeptide repeat protein n=1 Tax=Spirulina major TaxID=270636 RepID=UPI00093399D1|nr:tetratricopeptide repeat protein [Spirulina major]